MAEVGGLDLEALERQRATLTRDVHGKPISRNRFVLSVGQFDALVSRVRDLEHEVERLLGAMDESTTNLTDAMNQITRLRRVREAAVEVRRLQWLVAFMEDSQHDEAGFSDAEIATTRRDLEVADDAVGAALADSEEGQ